MSEKRQVHESCFDLLYAEFINYLQQRHDEDALRYILEKVGFRLGQRMAER